MSRIMGTGKVSFKKSGKGYENVWIYVPSKIAKDSSFPFNDQEEVKIEIKDRHVLVSKKEQLIDKITEYGLENATLKQLLEIKAVENEKKPFLLFQDAALSYQAVNEEANRVAHGIFHLIGDIDRRHPPKIAVMFPNCPDFIFYWFGISKTRAIFVPIDPSLRGEYLRNILANCECEYLALPQELLRSFQEVRQGLSTIRKVIVKDLPVGFPLGEFYVRHEEFLSKDRTNPEIVIQALYDPLEIIHTEGTTGPPKSVMYRNVMVLSGLIISDEVKSGRYGIPASAIVGYCATPLHQAFAQLVLVFPALFLNATIAIAEFDAATFWDDVRKYNANLIVYYGGIIQTLLNQPPRENDRKHPANWALGGQAPKHIWENFENRFGIRLFEGWAPTEAVAFTINTLGSRGGKVGSIGIPLEGFDVKIVDLKGRELPPGPDHIGEIVVKSSFPTLLEYFKPPAVTPMTLGKDGYIRTGDLAYKDVDGYFYYAGRVSDIIRRGGRVVAANIIENVANSHPLVLESAVFGVSKKGAKEEDIKICVVLKNLPGVDFLTPGRFLQFLSQNLAHFMVPRFIEFRPWLRQSSARVKKYLLRREWQEDTVRKRTWDTLEEKYDF